MSKTPVESATQEFAGMRGIFWPIHNFELKKFLPMGLMMLCILFNYTVLRDTKDALVVLAPAGGAETISFLKLYGVTPSAILFMIIFVKMANSLSRENLFYAIIIPFLIFFACFAWIVYPNRYALHMSLETIQSLQAAYPNLHYVFPVIGNWSFSIFYILSELWGSVVLSMLFWQFANHITRIHEAKRFYGLFGMIGNFGLALSGSLIYICSNYASSLGEDIDTWGINLKIQMSMVVISGLLTMLLYYWMHRSVLTDSRFFAEGEGGGKSKKDKPKLSLSESMKYLLQSKYLGLIAIIVLAYGIAINLVEGVWKGQIKIRFPKENDYLAFMGQFSFMTGCVTILMMVVGNNILRRLSWKTAASITPIMVLITSLIFFGFIMYSNQIGDPFTPFLGTTLVMAAIAIGQVQNVLSKATKYSLFDSTKQMAYIPLDPELKVKGQAAVEVIGGRAGKSGGAFIQSTLLAFIGGGVTLASLVPILGPIVIIVAILWLLSVSGLSKKFEELTKNKPTENKASA
jgi:AAA family ATP:ADP antiporter